MCFRTGCIKTLQGHQRSLILAPIDSTYMTSYWTSIVTLVLSSRISEILELLYAEIPFFHTPPLFRPKFWVFPLEQIRDVGSAESEHPKLTNSEIIFEECQPMWSGYLNVMDKQMTCRSNTTLCVASRGKNCIILNTKKIRVIWEIQQNWRIRKLAATIGGR